MAEHLLHASGAIPRLGRVDDGTASLDFEPEEHKRHLSLSLAVHGLDHDGTHVTLIDTPGYADFAGEVISGFAAADAALFTIDASGGVEAGTERPSRSAAARGPPALFLVTRSERENADADRGDRRAPRSVRQQDRAAPGADRQGPPSLRGFVDLVHRKA